MPAYLIDIEHREDDQVFSYYHGPDRSGGYEMLHFNVTLLARLREQMPAEFARITMDITDREYDLCMKHRGIEEPKVTKLIPRQLREPGYGCLFEDGSFTIVDGHHRLVRRYRGGVRVMDFWVAKSEVWRHALVRYTAEGESMIEAALPPKQDNPERFVSGVVVHPTRKP